MTLTFHLSRQVPTASVSESAHFSSVAPVLRPGRSRQSLKDGAVAEGSSAAGEGAGVSQRQVTRALSRMARALPPAPGPGAPWGACEARGLRVPQGGSREVS